MILISLFLVIFSIISTVAVIFVKNVKQAIVIFGVLSILSVFVLVLLNAPDVAITETSIGVLLTLFFYFTFLKRIDNTYPKKDGVAEKIELQKSIPRTSVILISIIIILIALLFAYKSEQYIKGNSTGEAHLNSASVNSRISYLMKHKKVKKTSPYLNDIENDISSQDNNIISKDKNQETTSIPKENTMGNVVTSIVVDYRSFDTFGELLILFTSIIGISFLISERKIKRISNPGVIISTAIPIISIFTVITGIYIVLHGHITPGGGFSGGAIISSGILLLIFTGRSIKYKKSLKAIEALSGIVIVIIGFGGLVYKNSIFSNYGYFGKIGDLISGGVLTLLYIFIGIKVASELISAGTLFHGEIE